MKTFLAFVLCFSLQACATSQAGVASPAGALETTANPAAGERLARELCGDCHSVSRRGKSPMPEAPAFRDLHKRYEVEGIAESLAEGISVGNPIMPEHVLEADQIRDLIAYLRTLER